MATAVEAVRRTDGIRVVRGSWGPPESEAWVQIPPLQTGEHSQFLALPSCAADKSTEDETHERRCQAHRRRWLDADARIRGHQPGCPFPAHLSAPAAVSLTARLGSSSSGPRRRTASRRARLGSTGRCCTSRASPAQALSRTSALVCWSCGTEQVVRGTAERTRRGARHGWGPRCPCSPAPPRAAPASPRLTFSSSSAAGPSSSSGSVPFAPAASAWQSPVGENWGRLKRFVRLLPIAKCAVVECGGGKTERGGLQQDGAGGQEGLAT